MKFSELKLRPEIQVGLEDMGYTELTPVQEQTFPHILAGRDLLAQAETGSGKTSACGIPLVQAVDESLNAVQGLIIVPTRELALQYVQELAGIARKTQIAPFAVYGGFSMDIQRAKLEHGVHILVGTPGRLIDLLEKGLVRLTEVRTFVLDEADEMLKMGFIDDVEFIFSCLLHEHQTMLFSATMPGEVKHLAKKYLKNPVTVELNIDQIAPENLEHTFGEVFPGKRFEMLLEYLARVKPVQAIIFCNSRRNCEKLFDRLKKKLKSVETIHGGLEQAKRTSLFRRFRSKGIEVMVATDVASRGLDFRQVSHVINYDFPASCDAYTHRTGRTARMGGKGVAMTFYTRHDLSALKTLLKVNRINPVWHGREPDLTRAPRRRRTGGYGRGRGRGRRR
ncbi:MAG: DEAD/DEAH box helicase [Planctomycetota bacterium]|jgi:ATP-dependent RNA helicase DeaD